MPCAAGKGVPAPPWGGPRAPPAPPPPPPPASHLLIHRYILLVATLCQPRTCRLLGMLEPMLCILILMGHCCMLNIVEASDFSGKWRYKVHCVCSCLQGCSLRWCRISNWHSYGIVHFKGGDGEEQCPQVQQRPWVSVHACPHSHLAIIRSLPESVPAGYIVPWEGVLGGGGVKAGVGTRP